MTNNKMRTPASVLHRLPQRHRRLALCELQSEGFGRRVYEIAYDYADGMHVRLEEPLLTADRIGFLVRLYFRSLFRRAPTVLWHVQGRTAVAKDELGNAVYLSQINYQR